VRIRRGAVRVALRACRAPLASHRISVRGKRKMYEAFTAVARPSKATRWQQGVVAGVPVERTGVGAEATLIYLHGGAYGLGSARGYRGVAGRLAAAAAMTVVVPDYSLSPEARYPVALEEMVAVYAALLADGLDPKQTVVAGDSAGGGLTLALAMALRDRGIALPAALGLICPWADLALDIFGRRPPGRDPLITPAMASVWAPRYAGAQQPRLPGISPVYGDMAGLPPIVMQSASDDPLVVDAIKIEKAIAATGVVEHRRFDGLWHDFHLQAGVLAEADEAIEDFGARLRTHTQGKVATK
jgi:monoterpene epsilon-lactone hydrolase